MADSPIFELGDVVQLKSGGPHVTVAKLIGSEKSYFQYYYVDKDGLIRLQIEGVLAAAFRKVEPAREPYTGNLPFG